MSRFDKLIERIYELDKGLRFDELKKVLKSFGYTMSQSKGGSSHYVFRKSGKAAITIPKHEPNKTCCVRIVKNAIMQEMEDDSNG